MAVGAVDGPADRDAALLGQDRPLPAELAPVRRVLPAPLPTCGCLMQAGIDRSLGEVEADDAVVGGDGLVGDRVVDAGCEPFVPAGSHRGVRYLLSKKRLGVLSRAARGEPDDHHLEAFRSEARRR